MSIALVVSLVVGIGSAVIGGAFAIGAKFAVPKVEKQSIVVDNAMKLVETSGREIERREKTIAEQRERIETLEAEIALLRKRFP